LIEVVLFGVNGWRCPLTAVAGRYIAYRRNSCEIPVWIARNSKLIFGALSVAGIALTFTRWALELE
jgi:hypothetical protein